MLTITRESPHRDGIIALIRQSDAMMAALYPAESNHLVDVDLLTQPRSYFFVVREDESGQQRDNAKR